MFFLRSLVRVGVWGSPRCACQGTDYNHTVFLCYDMILWYNSVFSMPQFKLLLKRSYIMPIFNYLSTKFITLNTIIMFIYICLT